MSKAQAELERFQMSEDEYCSKSDLPVEMCSHCRCLDKEEPPELVVLHRYPNAKYGGMCGACGKREIIEGDTIWRVLADGDEVWAGKCCIAGVLA